MYFWRVNSLVEDFRNDKVTEKEKLKYMILFGIVVAIISDPIMWIDSKYSIMDTINLIVMIVTTTLGTYYCYSKNKSGDNKDFITRFMCLGLPVGLRLFVFALPVFIIVGVIEIKYGIGKQINKLGEDVYLTTINHVVVDFFFELIYFAYLGKKLNEIYIKKNNA